MLYACVRKLDVTGTVEKSLGTKRCLNNGEELCAVCVVTNSMDGTTERRAVGTGKPLRLSTLILFYIPPVKEIFYTSH